MDPQELARNVDTFIAYRNTSAKIDQGGWSGGPKDVNRTMLSCGGATGGAPFIRPQQPGPVRLQHGGGGVGRGILQQGGEGKTRGIGTQMFVPSCTFCSKRGHSCRTALKVANLSSYNPLTIPIRLLSVASIACPSKPEANR